MEHQDQSIEHLSPEIETQSDNLITFRAMEHQKQLIEHLSREIKTQSDNLMTFRARINFAVFAGPFVVILFTAKGVPRGIAFDPWTIMACLGLALSYVAMGMACAAIERHIWLKCNVWRSVIGKLVAAKDPEIEEEELRFKPKLYYGYIWVYLWMILAFVCAMRVVSHIRF